MKRFLLLLFVSLLGQMGWGQTFKLVGTVVENTPPVPLEHVSVVLRNAQTSSVHKVSTNRQGRFYFSRLHKGKYLLEVSMVGYEKYQNQLDLQPSDTLVTLDTIRLNEWTNLLKTATVMGVQTPVQQVGDTTVYNASAYRLPPGSTLQALVRQLPGITIDENGKMKFHGKDVSELLINGKDFFKGNTNLAMENLPTELVDKIKAYDKDSDYKEQTGIDDGEEKTVLDITTKRKLNSSLFTNTKGSVGNQKRYNVNNFVSNFAPNYWVSSILRINNINNSNFLGQKGFNGNMGLTATKQVGINMSWSNTKKEKEANFFSISGSIDYQYTGKDLSQRYNSENFLSHSHSSFGNGQNRNISSNKQLNMDVNLSWNIDSLTNLRLNTHYEHENNDNEMNSIDAMFRSNPYDLLPNGDILNHIFHQTSSSILQPILLNSSIRNELGMGKQDNVSLRLNLRRKLNKKGRNISLQGRYGYENDEAKRFSIAYTSFYNGKKPNYRNQYTTTPRQNNSYGFRLGYAEPLWTNGYLETYYDYDYHRQQSNRSRYNLNRLTEEQWNDSIYHPAIGTLPSNDELLEMAKDLYNSRYAQYHFYRQRINIGIGHTTKKMRLSTSIALNPQHTKLDYQLPGQHLDTVITQTLFNLSPRLRFRYKFSNNHKLEINYYGFARQPSIVNLLGVVDDSNPLHVSMGNEDLKPSWQNNFHLEYSTNFANDRGFLNVYYNFTHTSNSISQRTIYDDATGIRYSRPENINGYWYMDYVTNFNFNFGADKQYTFTSETGVNYQHNVAFVSDYNGAGVLGLKMQTPVFNYRSATSSETNAYRHLFQNANTQKNTARNINIREFMKLGYKNQNLSLHLLGEVSYLRATNSVQKNFNLSTWQYRYGTQVIYDFDFGLNLSTQLYAYARKGYTDQTMNKTKVVWDVECSQSLDKWLKGLSVSVDFYDILHQQNNIERILTAQSRRDVWTNGINAYFMFNINYAFNVFSGKQKMKSVPKEHSYEKKHYHSTPSMMMFPH